MASSRAISGMRSERGPATIQQNLQAATERWSLQGVNAAPILTFNCVERQSCCQMLTWLAVLWSRAGTAIVLKPQSGTVGAGDP
eukprot:325029-Rhodomonas_salina.1